MLVTKFNIGSKMSVSNIALAPSTNKIKVYGIVTHGVLSEPALDRINESSLEKFIVTNTIPQRENMRKV